jgi:hypothetical protein
VITVQAGQVVGEGGGQGGIEGLSRGTLELLGFSAAEYELEYVRRSWAPGVRVIRRDTREPVKFVSFARLNAVPGARALAARLVAGASE